MKKIILLIIIIILFTGLSGCGLYNLNNFILPDDAEFLALIEELNTPRKICQYMLDNFESEIHLSYDLTPYQLFITRKGDCKDMSDFSQFIANYHGYETHQILISYSDTPINHIITVYKENNKYNFSDTQYYYFVCSLNFRLLVDVDSIVTTFNWLSYEVYNYDMNIIETGYNN